MRWEAVKNSMRVQEEQRQAALMKERKSAAIERQQRAAASELLASMLLEASYAELPDMHWRTEGCLDTRWNLGLHGPPTTPSATSASS